MEFGNKIIPAKKRLVGSKYLYFNTLNRNQGTLSEPTFYLPPNLFVNTNNKTKFLKISLYTLTINREWTDVIAGINDTFKYFDGANLVTITIPAGSYSIYAFRDYLNAIITNYVVTYSITTNKLTLTTVVPTSYITPINSGVFFGLIDGTQYTGLTFTSVNPVNMQYVSTIYLNTDIASGSFNLDSVNQSNFQTSTIIDRIPVQTPPYGNIIYHSNEKSATLEIPMLNHISSIRFWLSTDKLMKIENLVFPYTFTLRLDIYELE